MGKIMVLTVPENEERIFEWIEQYLIENKEFTITNSEQNILLTFPGLEIDIQNREVWIESGKVILTDLEFRILLFLAKRPGQIFSYQQIYEGVWNESYACEKGNIMSHISHIREKIKLDDSIPEYIENIRGVGYRFRK